MNFPQKYLLYIAWIQSVMGVLGSLFYSEIMQLAPCVLCWYQRILLYPLAIILAVGILRKDQKVYSYVLPFSILGMIVALYHTLLQQGVLPEAAAPCVAGVSCVVKQVGYFGFITIPLMSFAAFALITICMYLYKKKADK